MVCHVPSLTIIIAESIESSSLEDCDALNDLINQIFDMLVKYV